MNKSNKSVTRVLALFGLIATLAPLTVRAEGPMHFTVPFTFTVGSKSFAAGEYRITEVTQGVLHIQSEDARVNFIVQGHYDERSKLDGMATMTFHKYGGRYFLYKVANPSRGWGLPPSAGEKELIAGRGSSKPLAVIAASHR
jgi:hypothetical protein